MKFLKLSTTNQVTVWITAESHKYNKLHNKRMWDFLMKIKYMQSKYIGEFFDGAET